MAAVIGFCVLLHWITCAWALPPQLMALPRETPGLADALIARLARNDTAATATDQALSMASSAAMQPCCRARRSEPLPITFLQVTFLQATVSNPTR